MPADLFCLTDLGAYKLKMTKRKFTSDVIEDLLNKSDSEFDADDSDILDITTKNNKYNQSANKNFETV